MPEPVCTTRAEQRNGAAATVKDTWSGGRAPSEPRRRALNPIISTIGWTLPVIVSGETITAIVLSLPTTGPLLFRALLAQDRYLAGSTVMLLTVLGTLVSDVMLVWGDPRIRYARRESG